MSNAPARLLYVEDEAIVAMVVTIALEEASFQVEHVFNGKAAFEALQDGQGFLALVTDVRLPEIDGWSIAHRARELHPALPVIYVSGDSASEWSAKGVSGSVMLQKPFANSQLIATITSILNDTNYRSI